MVDQPFVLASSVVKEPILRIHGHRASDLAHVGCLRQRQCAIRRTDLIHVKAGAICDIKISAASVHQHRDDRLLRLVDFRLWKRHQRQMHGIDHVRDDGALPGRRTRLISHVEVLSRGFSDECDGRGWSEQANRRRTARKRRRWNFGQRSRARIDLKHGDGIGRSVGHEKKAPLDVNSHRRAIEPLRVGTSDRGGEHSGRRCLGESVYDRISIARRIGGSSGINPFRRWRLRSRRQSHKGQENQDNCALVEKDSLHAQHSPNMRIRWRLPIAEPLEGLQTSAESRRGPTYLAILVLRPRGNRRQDIPLRGPKQITKGDVPYDIRVGRDRKNGVNHRHPHAIRSNSICTPSFLNGRRLNDG